MVRQLERSTAFPCPIMLASSFDPDLAFRYAEAVGEECRAGGIEVLLGPGLNIARNSQCGRNFEYFGEDPLLTSVMAAAYVRGMQQTGTAACLKHFIGNETEFYRRRSNSLIGERALHEIYMPPFRAGIEAGAVPVRVPTARAKISAGPRSRSSVRTTGVRPVMRNDPFDSVTEAGRGTTAMRSLQEAWLGRAQAARMNARKMCFTVVFGVAGL